MKFNDYIRLYWKHYSDLEEEVFMVDKFCSIDSKNKLCYSRKFLELILSICSETDVVLKALCKLIKTDLNTKSCGIDDYKSIINEKYPSFKNETVKILKYDYTNVIPYKQFSSEYLPSWWNDYNIIKHHRDENNNFEKANLKNVIESLCGLNLALQYLAVTIYVDFNNIKEQNTELGRLHSEDLYISGWNYISFFNNNSCYVDEKSLIKHFNEISF